MGHHVPHFGGEPQLGKVWETSGPLNNSPWGDVMAAMDKAVKAKEPWLNATICKIHQEMMKDGASRPEIRAFKKAIHAQPKALEGFESALTKVVAERLARETAQRAKEEAAEAAEEEP